jgi:hypothetical protein
MSRSPYSRRQAAILHGGAARLSAGPLKWLMRPAAPELKEGASSIRPHCSRLNIPLAPRAPARSTSSRLRSRGARARLRRGRSCSCRSPSSGTGEAWFSRSQSSSSPLSNRSGARGPPPSLSAGSVPLRAFLRTTSSLCFRAAGDLARGQEFNSFAQHKSLRAVDQSKVDVAQVADRSPCYRRVRSRRQRTLRVVITGFDASPPAGHRAVSGGVLANGLQTNALARGRYKSAPRTGRNYRIPCSEPTSRYGSTQTVIGQR